MEVNKIPKYDLKKDNFLVKIYWKRVTLNTFKMLGDVKSKKILDFGCGDKFIKPFLKNVKYYGYDIDKEKTEINDYKKKKPDIFLSIHSLEYLGQEELELLFKHLCNIKCKRLVIALPTENILSTIILKILRRPSHRGRKSKLYQVKKILSKYYLINREKSVVTMTKIYDCYLK